MASNIDYDLWGEDARRYQKKMIEDLSKEDYDKFIEKAARHLPGCECIGCARWPRWIGNRENHTVTDPPISVKAFELAGGEGVATAYDSGGLDGSADQGRELRRWPYGDRLRNQAADLFFDDIFAESTRSDRSSQAAQASSGTSRPSFNIDGKATWEGLNRRRAAPRFRSSFKKNERVKTPRGLGNVWSVDKDGTVCVELDSDPTILHEFEKKEVKKSK